MVGLLRSNHYVKHEMEYRYTLSPSTLSSSQVNASTSSKPTERHLLIPRHFHFHSRPSPATSTYSICTCTPSQPTNNHPRGKRIVSGNSHLSSHILAVCRQVESMMQFMHAASSAVVRHASPPSPRDPIERSGCMRTAFPD